MTIMVTITTMTTTTSMAASSARSRLRLLQLTSPTLPVGAYAYSQGLEQAVEAGWVNDAATVQVWIGGLLQHALGALDVPVLLRLHAAWRADDHAAVRHWSNWLHACRESAELQAEDRQLGNALARLLSDLDIDDAHAWRNDAQATYVTLFALAAVRWDIDAHDAALGLAWSWCENQVLAALKLLPLGQTAGQRILAQLISEIPATVTRAASYADEDIGQLAPAYAIASAQHETQYSRLFRS